MSHPIYLRIVDEGLVIAGIGYVLLAIAIVVMARTNRSAALGVASLCLAVAAGTAFVNYGLALWAPPDCSHPPPFACRMSEPWSGISTFAQMTVHPLALILAGIAALISTRRRRSSPQPG